MAGQRAAGQKLINFPASDEFITELNRVSASAGYSSRSEFIRDAILEKAAALGVRIEPRLAAAPPRAGRKAEPFSSPVVDSIDYGKTGQNRAVLPVLAEAGSAYQAPSTRVPPPTREVPAEPLPDHTPAQRDAVLGSIPVAMKIARERAPGDRKRLAAQKAKAAKAAQDKAAMAARAEAWRAKQGK